MAYTKQTWSDLEGTGLNKYTVTESGGVSELNWTPDSITSAGTPVTADRMNYIEDGIETVSQVADDALPQTGGTVSGNLAVTGDLEVTGTVTSNGQTLNPYPNVMVRYLTASYTIPANGTVNITKEDLGISTNPTDYVPVGTTSVTTASQYVFIQTLDIRGGSGTAVTLTNTSSSQITRTFAVRIAYIKTS